MTPAPLYGELAALGGHAEFVATTGGERLRAALFTANETPRGSVVVSPGRTEPIEKYAELIGELQGRGFTVLAHDWRGQGGSDAFPRAGAGPGTARLGHARGWRTFISDFTHVLDVYADRLMRPRVALGHSMGGGLTLLALTEGETRFDAAVLTAPMLGLRLGGRPPALVGAVAALMTLLGRGRETAPSAAPRRRWNDGPGEEPLTHDRARLAAVAALLEAHPELRVGGPTWSWLQFALILTRRLRSRGALERVGIPITIVAAERDRVVAVAPQRAAAARLPRGCYVEVPGAFHELLIETDQYRAAFWQAFESLVAVTERRTAAV